MDKIKTAAAHRMIIVLALIGMIMISCCPYVFAGSFSDSEQQKSQDSQKSDDVIVMFRGSCSLTRSGAESKLGIESEDTEISVKQVWNFDSKKDISIALVTSDTDADELASRLRELPEVKYAEKDYPVHALSVSNDAYSDLQWSMQSSENAPNVGYEWNMVRGSDNVVAVVDTGVNYRHPDLKDNMWVNPYKSKGLKGKYGYDFISGDDDPADENGHGTHCAGIIGAAGDNGIGISGVNQKIRIMALRTLDADGSAMLSHEIAAYNYINRALDLGVPVTAINNSWGGGEESEIFRELVNLVGAKGAVTVCAAGNDGVNIDKYSAYPADIDSPYIITVAATREDGQLVSFSNYGKAVDIAAPGADILSTVSYDCYNPGIYGDDQEKLSSSYNSFESGSSELIPDRLFANGKEMQKNGSVFTDSEGRKVEIRKSSDGFRGGGLSISYSGLKEDDMICAPVSYTLCNGFGSGNTAPQMSAMVRTETEKNFEGYYMPPMFSIVETAADDALTMDSLGPRMNEGAVFSGKADYWRHIIAESSVEDELNAGDTRQFVYTMYACVGGDFEVFLDDAGISRDDLAGTAAFGKYDYYSGTSMAAPYISGAVALKKAEMEAGGTAVNVRDLINEVCSMTKKSPELAIGGKGQLDFRKNSAVLGPRIIRASVSKSDILLEGSGLDTSAPDFCVEITRNGKTSKITKAEGDTHSIRFSGSGWINNAVDIKVTANGSSYILRNAYLVDGKKKYSESDDSMAWGSVTARDGRRIYVLHNDYDESVYMTVYDTKTKQDEYVEYIGEELGDMIAGRYGIEKDKNKEYMTFVHNAAYSNGRLYITAEYGAADQTEEGSYSIYDGDEYLAAIDTGNNAISLLGKVGSAYDAYAMGAYNGKLYFAGGYSVSEKAGEDDRTAVSSVRIYDPAKRKWTKGRSMPQGRYGGKLLQSGGKLIYTLGYSADGDGYARNMIFDGKKWKISKTDFPAALSNSCIPSAEIIKGGLIYVGMPAEDYGDSFRYNIAKDRYEDSGYNLIREYQEFGNLPEKQSMDDGFFIIDFSFDDEIGLPYITAAAAGNKIYARKAGSDKMFTMPVKSGFISVKKTHRGKGSVTGPSLVQPGDNARIKIKAGKGYRIKSIRVNGKKVKAGKNAAKAVYTFKRIAKNSTIAVSFARK